MELVYFTTSSPEASKSSVIGNWLKGAMSENLLNIMNFYLTLLKIYLLVISWHCCLLSNSVFSV